GARVSLGREPVAAHITVLAAHADVGRVVLPHVADLARHRGVDARERALREAVYGAVSKLHLDRAAVDEVELLLDLVRVKAALHSRGHDDRVHAERAHAKGLADLAKAGGVAERAQVGDRVAGSVDHVPMLPRGLHLAPFWWALVLGNIAALRNQR